MNPRKIISTLAMMMSVAVAFAGDPTAPVADKLAQALTLYGETKFDEGIALAESCLKQEGVTSQDSIAIYEVLSIINYAKGEEFLKISVGYLDRIAKIGPCVIPLPHEIWPQELRDKWYQILRAKDALTCKPETSGGLKTIAIMEFDNFSTGKYQEQLGALSKGLADFFQHDFAKISALKVVERDKIDFVLKELELQKTGAVDPATAAKVGKILGAQIMVFGSVTQIEDNMSRMIVRAVNVETSEIIASVDKEGKPEYSKMEKELVKELAQALDITISDDIKEMIMEGGTESLDATAIYSKGLDYMDKYDYKNAYECFKKAYELDNTFAEAKRKMEIYRPLAG